LPGGWDWSSGKPRGRRPVFASWLAAWGSCCVAWVSHAHQRDSHRDRWSAYTPAPGCAGHNCPSALRSGDGDSPANELLAVFPIRTPLSKAPPSTRGTFALFHPSDLERTTGAAEPLRELGSLHGPHLSHTEGGSFPCRADCSHAERLLCMQAVAARGLERSKETPAVVSTGAYG